MWTFHIPDYIPVSLLSLFCNSAQLDPTHKQNVFLRNTQEHSDGKKEVWSFLFGWVFLQTSNTKYLFPTTEQIM